MADQFKYIINATLKLNAGSLTQLVNDVKAMDKDIKAEFDKQKTSVKVPLTADQDIQRLRAGVNRIIEGYNKGQAPSIKIKVVPDENSISALQKRIAEVRKELSSLSDEQARVSVNTSLVVGRNEGEEVQKQVEGIKPTIEVNVIPNEESLKKLKSQIESIKADVQATVRAIEEHPTNMNRVGYRPTSSTSSVGRTSTNRRINVPRTQADRFVADRKALTDEINTITANIKLLEKEEKLALSANEIQKRIDSLQQAQSDGKTKWNIRDDSGHVVKGTSTVKSDDFDEEIKKYRDLLKQADELSKLKVQWVQKMKEVKNLENSVAYGGPSKSKPTPRSHISPDSGLGQALAEIDAKNKEELLKQDALDKAEKKRQAEAEKAEKKRKSDAERKRIQIQRDNERTVKRTQQISYNRLNRGRGSAETQDRKLAYIQSLEDAPNRYVSLVEQRSTLQNRVAQLKDLTGGYSNGKTGAEKRSQYSPQALAHVQSMIDKLNGDIQSLDNEINIERAKLQEHVNKLYGNDAQGRKLRQAQLGGSGVVDHTKILQSQVKTQTVANVKAENDAKIKAWEESQAQAELERQWKQTGAYSELPANGRVAKIMAKNQARQTYLDSKTESVNKKISNYQNHIRQYGPNGMYSAESMIDALKDPNVSLADSKKILENLNAYQAQQARATGMNFQKSYPMKWLDGKGNLQEANTMVYQYTKLGEVIEKADKGFLGMMDHVTNKVGVFSALEGGIVLVTEALASSIEEMVQFNQQLAEIQSTTQNLNNTGLKPFYQTAGGTNQLQSSIQSNAFNIGKQFGVDTLNTVMPIYQAVTARPDLIGTDGTNSKLDENKQNEIVKNIMQFSAISTGGKEDEQTVNELTHDLLSLYQANQTANPKGYMGDMTNMLDYLSAMHSYGVNTTNVTNAMAELAPESLKLGINNNQAMALMGTFDLANTGGKPEETENVGKTFYNSIMHANTNSNLKDTLSEYLKINLDANPMSPNELIKTVIERLPMLKGNDIAMQTVASALSSSGGGGTQAKAMMPLMTKFLEGSQSETFKKFMDMSGNSQGAMDNAWGPYSKTLKTNIEQLVQSFKQLAQLLGQLGVADFFGSALKFVTLILNALDSILGKAQQLSAFFKDRKIFDFSEFTTSALMFLGTAKMIQKFFNAKQWGGYVGSYIAQSKLNPLSPWGVSYGIKQNPPISSVGAVSSAVQTAETVAPSVLPLATGGNTASKITAEEAKFAESKIMANRLKSTGMMSALEDTLAYSATGLLSTRTGKAPKILQEAEGLARNRKWSIPDDALTAMAFGNAKVQMASELGPISKLEHVGGAVDRVGSGVKNFMSQALFIPQLKSLGGAISGTGAVGAEAGVVSGFTKLAPMLLDFGLLLTRLTVIGGALALSFEGVKLVADEIAKERSQQQNQVEKNVSGLQKQAQKDPRVAQEIQDRVKQLQKYNQSGQHELANNPIQQKYGVRTDVQNKGEANVEYLKKYGINYHKSLTGNDTISYIDPNTKKEETVHVNKPKEMKIFNDFLNNGIKSDTQKIADQWKMNTDYLGDYGNQLKVVNTLTTNLSESMKLVNSQTKAVDATFGGINSSDALSQKISITQTGIDTMNSKMGEISPIMDKMGTNKDRLNSQYNNQRDAIKNSGISESKISDMETQIMVARANGSDPKGIIEGFKKDPKMEDLATAFNTLQDFTTALNGSQDNYLSLKDQYSQMIEQQKQYQAQLAVTKLGIDSMNASLQNLGVIASASKALVDINQNVLNTGDNSAQIGALSSSMQVSSAQMGNMVSQQGMLQNGMDKIRSANPNQDFSLDALYNPKGQVTPEQLAYKAMYEQSQQTTQNISSQSSAMYQQLTQMRDLVLTSTKYADTWQRVQENVQLVKDSIKQTSDFQIQMSTLDSNAQIASIGGKNPFDARNEQLVSMRDASLQMAEKLNNALTSSGGDNQKLQEAMAEIQKNEGTEFEKSFINPLNDIVKNFTSTNSAFNSSTDSFKSAVDKFSNAVGQQQQQAQQQAQSQNVNLPGGSVSSAGVIGPYESTQVLPMAINKVVPTSGPMVDAINKLFANSPDLHGYGADYVDIGGRYGVDPRLLASITMAETGGNSSALRDKNNVGGIMGSGGLKSYATIFNSVEDLANILKKYYFDEGLNTIPAIQSKYAPYNADNDPNHLNDNWRNNVSSIYSQLSGVSVSQLLGGDQIASGSGVASSSAPAGGGGGNGGVNGMFNWFNSVLNNTSAMHYQWGGAHVEESWDQFISKAAADCSGLVEQVYKQFGGLDLGTTTADGLMHDNNGGTAVSRNQLQAGDMVFFGQGQSASHVGIYAGNNQMYTIDHDGMPVTKENLWSDYIGGKHFNLAGGTSGPLATSASSAIDVLVQETNQLQQGLADAVALVDPNKMTSDMNYKFDTNRGILLGNGNIQDVMGTSGIVSSYDAVIKQRQDIYAQEAGNRNEILYQNARRDDIISKMNQASASGDAPSYNELHAQLAYTDQYIQALVDNTNAMKSLDAKYAQMQQEDPRTNYDSAGQKIQGGVSVLRLMNSWGTTFGNDYFRLVGEVNNMESQYATHQKFTDEMKKLWDTFGTQTAQYSATKMNSDQDYVNLTYQKLNDINGVMKQFAQGTQDWYSVLESAVGAQQQLRDLEQKRLDDAKNMYNWTGQGLGAYIQQQAYITSRDYTQNSNNLSSAIAQYQSGSFASDETGYGLSSGTFRDKDSAIKANGVLTGKFGVGGNIVQNPDGTYRIVTDQNLSQGTASDMGNALNSSTQGYGLVTGAFGNNDFGFVSAHTIADGVKAQFGIDTQVINPDGQHIMVRTANQNISQDEYAKMSQFISDQYHVLTAMTGDGSQNTTLGGGKYGIQTSHWGNNDFGFTSAHTVADDIANKFGVGMNVINPTGDAISLQSKDQNLSQSLVQQIEQYMQEKFGLISWQTGSSGTNNPMDFNQQMASLQAVADAHNKMTEQMNTYRQTVTDGFKAGALSIDDYISKLNQLRNVQTEQKENAVNMIGNISSGFSSALNDALTQGMQGSINSPLDFMNSIKSTLSSSISGQLTSTLLNNTGLQDVMNKITTSVTQASTSGDPNAIVNMFNNNDFGKQMQDAIAPFLPMIQQIVGSTKGIFTILKDQVYNAPSGFKIDNYMNEVASSVGYQGIKNMNPNVNSVGSPILNFSSGTIQTTAPSQTPTGIPTGTSTPVNGTTTQTGAPENTFGAGSPPPDTSGYTNAGNDNLPWAGPPAPPAPAPAPSSSSGGRTYTVQSGDNPWTIENKLGLPHGWIVQHNNINPNKLQIGQVLQYHTGGIAGITNFASAQGLKSNELSAILQKSETIFQPKQLDDLVNGAMRLGANASSSGEGVNINVTVNFSGDTSDKGTIEQTVNTAVQKALQEFKKTTRLNNLSWKGTSY